jgi:hypothetical protein
MCKLMQVSNSNEFIPNKEYTLTSDKRFIPTIGYIMFETDKKTQGVKTIKYCCSIDSLIFHHC